MEIRQGGKRKFAQNNYHRIEHRRLLIDFLLLIFAITVIVCVCVCRGFVHCSKHPKCWPNAFFYATMNKIVRINFLHIMKCRIFIEFYFPFNIFVNVALNDLTFTSHEQQKKKNKTQQQQHEQYFFVFFFLLKLNYKCK